MTKPRVVAVIKAKDGLYAVRRTHAAREVRVNGRQYLWLMDAALRFSVSVSTLHTWIAKKHVKSERVGRYRYVCVSDMQAMLNAPPLKIQRAMAWIKADPRRQTLTLRALTEEAARCRLGVCRTTIRKALRRLRIARPTTKMSRVTAWLAAHPEHQTRTGRELLRLLERDGIYVHLRTATRAKRSLRDGR